MHSLLFFKGNRRFYMTQAPLPQTVHSFWDMVVQENVDAIVNLTELKEGGREKCVPYWPEAEGDESRVNKILFIFQLSRNMIYMKKRACRHLRTRH